MAGRTPFPSTALNQHTSTQISPPLNCLHLTTQPQDSHHNSTNYCHNPPSHPQLKRRPSHPLHALAGECIFPHISHIQCKTLGGSSVVNLQHNWPYLGISLNIPVKSCLFLIVTLSCIPIAHMSRLSLTCHSISTFCSHYNTLARKRIRSWIKNEFFVWF